MPEDGHSGSSEFETPQQSIGSRGVRTISSKLLLALYPPNAPCFKYQIDDFTIDQLSEQQGTRGEFDEALDRRARAVKTEMENSKFRPLAFESVRQLVVSGNYLLYVPTDPKAIPRGYRLDSYVIARDPTGTLLEGVIKEKIAYTALPEEVQEAIKTSDNYAGKDIKDEDKFDLYTHFFLNENGKIEEYQQVEDTVVKGSEGTHRPELNPYVPLRFTSLENEDYGRGLIEEFIGDLLSLEGLMEAVLEGAAASSRLIFLVNPNGSVSVQELEEAENGAFVEGQPEEVRALQVEKQADLQVALQMIQDITQRLSLAFMMHQSVQRNAERVTAEEIRRLTEELDDALGGVYSLLAIEFQLPVVRLYEKRMERAKRVPALPKEADVKPVIVTGIEALGRAHSLASLDNLIGTAAQYLPPEQIAETINLPEYFKQRAAALNIDARHLVINQEQQGQQGQQQQMMQMLQEMLPQLIQQGGGMAKEGMKQQAETERAAQQEA